jgi:hypothetical protein
VPFGCTAQAVPPRYSGGAIELGPGAFELTYTPTSAFRRLYSDKSRFDELAASPAAMKILAEEIPSTHAKILEGDREFMANTLEEAKAMFFFGISPKAVERAASRLEKIIFEEKTP